CDRGAGDSVEVPGPPQTQTDCRGCDAQAFGAVLRCAENRQSFRCGDSDGRLSHIKELIAWRTHFHASGRRFTHNSSGQSKNPLTAITVSTATAARLVMEDIHEA